MTTNAPKLRPVLGAFDKGQAPTIVCVNQATAPLGVDFDKLIAAMNDYIAKDFAPVWGTPCKLVKSAKLGKGTWAMVFLDNADEAGALAYHDLTADGFPLMKVFVKTTLSAGDLVSVSASHELVESLVDPAINLTCTGPAANAFYAYESADPVEELSYAVNGIQMSDWVYPSYFEAFRKAKSTQFDRLGKVTKPFQILAGGYQSIFKNGRWTETFGSAEKALKFSHEDRRGHRSEMRGKQLTRAAAHH